MNSYVEIMRPKLWFKNILVFAPLFFTGLVFSFNYYPEMLFRMILFCMASGFSYVINDIFDRKNDLHHPIKKNRPLPSGRLSLLGAIVLIIGLGLTIGIGMGLLGFISFIPLYMINTFVYSRVLKNYIGIDNVSVAINYCLRLLEGYIVLSIMPSIYPILTVFFLLMLMNTLKKKEEHMSLKHDAVKHRKSLKGIKFGTQDIMIACFTSLFIWSIIMSLPNELSLLTIPLVALLTIKYIYFIDTDPDKIMYPNRVFKDKQFTIIFAILVVSLIVTMVIG